MMDNNNPEVPPVIVDTAPAPTEQLDIPVPNTATPVKKEKPQVIGQTNAFGGLGFISEPVSLENIKDGLSPNPLVNMLFDYNNIQPVPLADRKDITGPREVVSFLAERGNSVDERIRAYVSPKALVSGRGRDWNEGIIYAASSTAFLDDRFSSTTQREGAMFKQFLDTEHGKIGYTAPKALEAGVGSSFTGEKALHRVRSILGMAGQCSVPMYHSGFWITLQAPSDSDLIELQRRIQEEKIELGRETYGLVFSNEQSYINSFLLDFCLEHIHTHTVRIDNTQDLKALIKVQDLNVLFWGMACLIWPRGFDYVRSLMSKEGIENTEVISAKISVGKLLWVDNASFDDKHRAHFAQKQRYQMTVESIEEYQKTFVPSLAAGRVVKVREGLELLIASTNAENYIADGSNWITGIVQTVDSTFTQAVPDEASRNRMIDNHARASRLRNYGAWVKAVIIDGQENTDRQDIVDILNLLSAEEDIVELVVKEITKFMDDSTRVIIAIPETNGSSVELPLFPNLIPIDVINTFFTLLAQRVNIIKNR